MDEYAYNKIFVGGLHYDTRDAEFKQYFEKFGKVISAEVMFNRETHKSRGFGFIVFEQENGAGYLLFFFYFQPYPNLTPTLNLDRNFQKQVGILIVYIFEQIIVIPRYYSHFYLFAFIYLSVEFCR